MADYCVKVLAKTELCSDKSITCPNCGSQVYDEVWEDERKVYLVCEQKGCDFEAIIEYEYVKFTFRYRDEFTTEILDRSLEEALDKINSASWRRTGWSLWEEYLEVRYQPDYELD